LGVFSAAVAAALSLGYRYILFKWFGGMTVFSGAKMTDIVSATVLDP